MTLHRSAICEEVIRRQFTKNREMRHIRDFKISSVTIRATQIPVGQNQDGQRLNYQNRKSGSLTVLILSIRIYDLLLNLFYNFDHSSS